MRVGAVDVGYPEAGGAVAALVIAEDPAFSMISTEKVVRLAHAAAYRPGAFFERELPPLRAVLDGESLDLLVIDGYVHLDPEGRPGLGAHARAAFGVPVMGVAKTRFLPATHAIEVRRGGSGRPLYVTAAGIDPACAAEILRAMAGEHRVPDALRRVDRLSRCGP